MSGSDGVVFSRMRTLLLAATLILLLAAPTQAANNPNGVAVIIGNKNYASSVPTVDYAHNDAKAIKLYVLDVLGFREGNIIDLRNATQTQLLSVFGNERTHEGTIWQYVRPKKSDVVVFYSGHGVPGQKDQRGYLLPVDANPDTPEINGYPIDLLYKNLSKIKSRTTTVFLDTCFSGESAKGMLIRSASPIHIKAKMSSLAKGMTVITAAQGDQLASWDDKAQHGLFTEHLLEALYGKADGNKNGQVTLWEVRTYLDEEMTYAARRRFSRHQQATVLGDDDIVLASYSPGRPFKRSRVAVQEPVSPVPVPPPTPQPAMSDASIAWQSVQNSTNIAEVEAFILAFRSSPLASMARVRLSELKKNQVASLRPAAKQNEASPISKGKAIVLSALPKGFYSRGSSVDEVLRVQGTPSKISEFSDQEWWYYGRDKLVISKSSRTVSSWSNSSGQLKVKLIPTKPSNSSTQFYSRGSSVDEVLRVQGTPSKISEFSDQEWWYYGRDKLVISKSSRTVSSWSNSSGQLKVKLIPIPKKNH